MQTILLAVIFTGLAFGNPMLVDFSGVWSTDAGVGQAGESFAGSVLWANSAPSWSTAQLTWSEEEGTHQLWVNGPGLFYAEYDFDAPYETQCKASNPLMATHYRLNLTDSQASLYCYPPAGNAISIATALDYQFSMQPVGGVQFQSELPPAAHAPEPGTLGLLLCVAVVGVLARKRRSKQ